MDGRPPPLLAICCLVLWNIAGSQATSGIPIGLLVDHNDSDTLNAFQYALWSVNRKEARHYHLRDVTIGVELSNSFSVGSHICRMLSDGVFVFFVNHTMSTISTIKSYSTTFHVPFVSSGMAVNSSRQENGYEIYIRPHYARALLHLIIHYNWKEVWYLYDTNEGLERLQQLFDAVTEEGYAMRTHVYRVKDADDAYDTLQRIDARRSDEKRLLLDLPTKECERLIDAENKVSRTIVHHYMLVGLGICEFPENLLKTGGMNVTGLRLVDLRGNSTVRKYLDEWHKNLINPSYRIIKDTRVKVMTYELGLVLDAVQVLQSAIVRLYVRRPNIFHSTLSDGAFYNNGSKGISCDAEPLKPWEHGSEIMRALRETHVHGTFSGNIQFDKFGLRTNYKLDVLEVSLNRGLATIGTWSPDGGLVIHPPAMVRLKGNTTFANKTRIVTSIAGAPFLTTLSRDSGLPLGNVNDLYEGYCADLARDIANIIQFDYEIRPVKDGKFGSNDSGTWDGMVGELLRGEADMAIAPLTITSGRENVIDFSKPFMSLGISIMIKKPTKDTPGVFSFMNPLSYEVWMCVIFAYIGVSVVLFLVSRFSPFEWHIEDGQDGVAVANNFTIFNSLWFSLGAFMQQGVDIEPRSMSGRIVGSVWWFFTLILISSYTANLAAFLTAERMQSPIESAEDLAKQTEIKYGTLEGGSTKDFFRKSTFPVYERMWAFMSSAEPSVFVNTTDEGVRQVRIRNGKYAFLLESTTNDYVNHRKPCDTMKVGGNLDAKGYGIGTPMGSDLRDRITLAVLELTERGELTKLEKTWWYDKGDKECVEEGAPKKQEATSALKLPNVAGIFYILISGLALSLVIALIEFLHKTRLEAKRRKTSFTSAARTGARLSITGQREVTEEPVDIQPDIPPNMSMSTYSYAPAAQLVGIDGCGDSNLQTQV